jgi:hypothetical protein
MNSITKLPEHRCQFCGREATKLCDKVKGEYRWAGHPPRSIGMCIHPTRAFTEPMTGIITCDAMICDKCATNITGMDLCPKCLKEIRLALK